VLVWALASDHATPKGAVEGLWQTALPFAVFWGVLVSLYYLAIEPWVRRELAGRQISWSRVLAGRWRDPLVGRDILLGLLWSIGSALLGRLGEFYVLGIGGPPTAVPWVPNESRYLVNLMGPFSAMTGIVHSVWSGFVNGFFFFAFLVVFSLLLRKKWFAVAAMVAYLTLSPALLSEGTPEFISYLLAFLWAVLIVIGMFRFGLLAMVIQSFAFVFLRQTFITPDFSTWYGASSLVALIAISALALVGFRLSVLGRPLWAAQSKSGAQISRA
jgi:serine/threonine-protein kinase